MEKILLATDFGMTARESAKEAAELAGKFDSEIIPIHIIPDLDVPAVTMKMVKSVAEKELHRLSSDLTNMGLKVHKPLLMKGNPFYRIINQAELHDVNVILMGSGDKQAGESVKLGTTAEKVIRKSLKPVWIVKSYGGIRKILCPVDFSSPSKRALKNAIHLARVLSAELTIMLVIKSFTGVLKGMGDELIRSIQKSSEQKNLPRFEKFLKGFNFHNVRWNKVIRHGIPHQEILDQTMKMKANLIVMGSVGANATRLSYMGNVAEKVLREVPTSIITVKAEDSVRLRLQAEMKDIHACAEQGEKLLHLGMAEEAITHFNHCLTINALYAPAWAGIAAAYSQIGKEDEVKKYREKVKEIQDETLARRINAEMRARKFRK
jgi:universal stress protein E